MSYFQESELHFQFSRSSGPGGQNVNKVNSKVTMKWELAKNAILREDAVQRFREKFANTINRDGFVVVVSDKFRDQSRNMDDCRTKLEAMIEEIIKPPKKRKPTKPTTSARMRRLDSKKQRGDIKKNRSKVDY